MQILLPQPTPADFAQKTPFDAASTNGKKTREMDLCVELDLPRVLLPATVAVSKRAWCVAARFVTSARFVTKVTKRAAMPARFVTNEVVTNRAGIALFFSLGYRYM